MRYLIIDNNKPERNVVVITNTRNEAINHGSSILKTWNVRCIPAANNTLGSVNRLGFNVLAY